MHQFHTLLKDIIANGEQCSDRTGVGTRSLFGYQMRFNLAHGFPICTSKSVPFKSVLSELLWFVMGSTNVNVLRAILHGVENKDSTDPKHRTIWDDNYENQAKNLGYGGGDLGPIYGQQWRRWEHSDYSQASIDQLGDVIRQIKANPDSRRHLVVAWNPSQIEDMALPPCHCLFQFRVMNGKLHCQLYQRSADVFLGVPFNIASYALLTHMVAKICGLEAGDFVWTGGDVHLYNNHIDQANEMLCREVRPLPSLLIEDRGQTINDFVMEDFTLLGYDPHPPIKAKMAI